MSSLFKLNRVIRFIVFNLLAWIAVIPAATLVLIAWPFGHRYSYLFAHAWASLVLWLARQICGLRFRVRGAENIPAESCIFFVKHSSAFETFGSLVMFPRNCWVLKQELLWVPFFGWALVPLDSIAIDRSKGSVAVNQVISQGINRLKRGINVVVFPEGTRMPAGTTKRYGISGTLLAQKSGSLIVPVAHNAGNYWPRRGLGIIPGEIDVVIGKPIVATGREPREINQEIQSWIESEIEKMEPRP